MEQREQNPEPKPVTPTEEHWHWADLAAKSAWKRWRHSYEHVSADDIVPELMLACMYQYERWDPRISGWFQWCCFVTRKKLISMLRACWFTRELPVEEFLAHEPATRHEDKVYVAPEKVYRKLHPLDQWVVDLRCQFTSNWEVHAYLNLCGMSDEEFKRSSKRIYNTTISDHDREYNDRHKVGNRLTKILNELKATEERLTPEQISMILDGYFEYRQSRNVSGKHRKVRPCLREKRRAAAMRTDTNAADVQ